MSGLGKAFAASVKGNAATIFGIVALPAILLVGAAVDYARQSSSSANLQAAVDAAALATIQKADSSSAAAVQSLAQSTFDANFHSSSAQVSLSATYSATDKILTVSATGTNATTFMKIAGQAETAISATAKARLGGGPLLPVCVMVTDLDSNHTLLAENNSRIDFHRCMVQVNTLNWDAVESRDTSYIHSTDGQNCFVGEIHYGDVLPPKSPTCTFFPDPFSSFQVPVNGCDYTNMVVNSAGSALNPGTYCGGLSFNASATLRPGLYIIRDGAMQVTGGANVSAKDVTFVLTGRNAGLSISGGSIDVTPNRTGAAGRFAGFAFYLDSTDPSTMKKKSQGKSVLSGGAITGEGIFYFAGQILSITNGATVTINPGSIIADFILPNRDGRLDLTGSLNTSTSNEIALQKVGYGDGGPILIR